MKDGYKTTEFWLTLVSLIITVLAGANVLSQDDADKIGELVAATIPGVVGLVAYIISRTKVKTAISG